MMVLHCKLATQKQRERESNGPYSALVLFVCSLFPLFVFRVQFISLICTSAAHEYHWRQFRVVFVCSCGPYYGPFHRTPSWKLLDESAQQRWVKEFGLWWPNLAMAATKAAEYQLEFLNCGAQDTSLPAASPRLQREIIFSRTLALFTCSLLQGTARSGSNDLQKPIQLKTSAKFVLC